MTAHQALLIAWDQSGVMPKQLEDLPDLPEHGLKVWLAFQDLHVTRRSGLNGPERLGFTDLHAWQIVTRSELEPWELRALFRIDREYMAHASAEAAKSRGA